MIIPLHNYSIRINKVGEEFVIDADHNKRSVSVTKFLECKRTTGVSRDAQGEFPPRVFNKIIREQYAQVYCSRIIML